MRRHRAPASPSARRGASARTLRIIGGSWRGRHLRFPPSPEIRPTPDRVRETLFNWLAARVPGARCLDLFAGSGALGLEALSRGAAHVTLVERDAAAAREIASRLQEWGAHAADVAQTDARGFLERPHAAAFDIVFLDPPFASTLLAEAAARLEHGGWLTDDALIYVEYPADAGARTPAAGTEPRAVASPPTATSAPPVPSGWVPLKSKRAGEVGYHLYLRAARGDSIE
jgi:16S rRNA (guanine966-N2)-methyltransferase